jgi:leader peptidase (prepilin peptidase) / N-methyltransferase
MELVLITVFLIALCWGSFLNMLAHRILHGKSLLTKRSACPTCHAVIPWYCNIPLLSWLALRGRCLSCKKPISFLYPCTELVTAVVLTGLFEHHFIATGLYEVLGMFIDLQSQILVYGMFATYVLFFSALIMAVRTDLEAMLIPQCFTLWMIPFGLLCGVVGFLEVTLQTSVAGAVVGYGILWIVAAVFKWRTGRDGMGVGDMELLAMIGTFLGPVCVWTTLMIASLFGIVVGGIYLVASGKGHGTRIPFGPFLALGATLFFFYGNQLLAWLMIV